MQINNLKQLKERVKLSIKNFLNRYFSAWRKKKTKFVIAHFGILALVAFLFFFNAFFAAPTNFPESSIFSVQGGETLNRISFGLQEENIVKSAFWFRNAAILLRGERGIKSGEYFFNQPENAFEVAKRLRDGDFGLSPIRITIPEGLNVFEIAEILATELPEFDKHHFVKTAQESEGFLFPDTYFLPPNAKVELIIDVMQRNFQQRISKIEDMLKDFGKPIEEIISLASIVETEARDPETRRIISGILWRRLEIGMPLQVDVTFKYINGKNTYQLTSEDLKIDSPYNTYVYAGLPPTPIANPSIDAILAAIEPVETKFLYFLSDRLGNMYYAATHEEHVLNKRKYLNLQ